MRRRFRQRHRRRRNSRRGREAHQRHSPALNGYDAIYDKVDSVL